jgi:hypothetical protein
MRVRTVLRVVALVSTLAGPAVLSSTAAAAPKKSASKSSSKKSSSKSSAAKSGSKSKTASKSSSTAKATPAKASTSSSAKAAFDPVAQRGPTRIDFDDRLIQGQTNKSGAVYLYDRKELKQRSMIKKRETFREEIVGAVYDSEL